MAAGKQPARKITARPRDSKRFLLRSQSAAECNCIKAIACVPAVNHYFDAIYQAIVARSMRGIGVLETPALPTMPAVQPTGPVQPATSSVATFERNRW